MIPYIANKILNLFVTLLGVVTLVFFLLNILPGDPARMMLGQNDDLEQLNIIKKKYAFDKPLSKQYILYLNDLSLVSFHSNNTNSYTFFEKTKYKGFKILQFDSYSVCLKQPFLRTSFVNQGKNVSEIIYQTLPNTIVLATSSMVIAVIFGFILAIISVLYKDSFIDISIQFVSTIGMSLPSFFSAILFAWIFGFILRDYTGLEMTGSLYELDDYGEKYHLKLRNLILPSLVLGIRPISVISQLLRNELVKVLGLDYIRTAHAKGLSSYKIIKNHALKNSLNPVITSISGWFASLLAGAVFVEYIFGWNGIGKEIVNALNELDIPVIMGCVITIAFIFIIINSIVDIIYVKLDPRIKI